MSLATCQLNPSVYQGASTQRAINIHCNMTVFSHISLQHSGTQSRVVSMLLEGYRFSSLSALQTLWEFGEKKKRQSQREEVKQEEQRKWCKGNNNII